MNSEIVLLYLNEIMSAFITATSALFIGFSLLMATMVIAVGIFRPSRSQQGE